MSDQTFPRCIKEAALSLCQIVPVSFKRSEKHYLVAYSDDYNLENAGFRVLLLAAYNGDYLVRVEAGFKHKWLIEAVIYALMRESLEHEIHHRGDLEMRVAEIVLRHLQG